MSTNLAATGTAPPSGTSAPTGTAVPPGAGTAVPPGAGTAVPPGAGTATGPTLRSSARRYRGPLAVLLVLLVLGAVLGVLGAGSPARLLDPDSYAPRGARAVAQVLRDQGVPVTRVPDVPAALAAASDDTTLVVTDPARLVDSELEALGAAPGALLVVGAQDADLAALGVPVQLDGTAEVARRRPACSLPAAIRAGIADLGGGLYTSTQAATGCYATAGAAPLLRLDERGDSPGITLLGSGSFLSNDKVDEQGNAALALGLLGERAGVVWLVPRADRAIPAGERPSLGDLIPDGVYLGALQLAIAVAVLALVRARRLGRVVTEPLPVVVRAAEAVEGRGRLYRLADARGTAADALRAATRDRLSRRLGIGPTTAPDGVVEAVSRRAGSDPAEVGALLYGGAPPDDGGLTRLAAGLRTLENDIREAAGS